MMRAAVLCFSQKGLETGKIITEGLRSLAWECSLDGKSKYLSQSIPISHVQWTKERWETVDLLLFVGACGIAVRSIAPFVASKKTDPAVLTVDECGKYVISLLSGHLGGANEFAQQVANLLHALPIITTATDLHDTFAVDVFAKKNRCHIVPMSAAKAVSAALLAGESVGFYSELPLEGTIPNGLLLCDKEGMCGTKKLKIGIAVSIFSDCKPFLTTVHLVPQIVTMGIGCRKGKTKESILEQAESCLKIRKIERTALAALASIDLKKDEAGLNALANEWNLPLITYSEEALQKVSGAFTASEFVKHITGVDNVCERSALLASDQGTLLQKKQSANGVTIALALKDGRMYFA